MFQYIEDSIYYYTNMLYLPLFYSLLPLLLFVGYGGVTNTKNYIIKFNKMNSMLFRFKKTGKYKIILLTLTLLIKSIYFSIIYNINNNVIKKNDKLYEIIYYIKGNKYILCIDMDKKPEYDVLQILDQDLNDCTDDILPYLGPMCDLHNNELRPKFFNKTSLIFTMSDDREIIFYENDIIKI